MALVLNQEKGQEQAMISDDYKMYHAGDSEARRYHIKQVIDNHDDLHQKWHLFMLRVVFLRAKTQV